MRPLGELCLPSNDAGVGAGTLSVEDLDSVELRGLGYSVFGAADGTSDVSSMTVAVSGGSIASIVGEVGSTCDM